MKTISLTLSEVMTKTGSNPSGQVVTTWQVDAGGEKSDYTVPAASFRFNESYTGYNTHQYVYIQPFKADTKIRYVCVW